MRKIGLLLTFLVWIGVLLPAMGGSLFLGGCAFSHNDAFSERQVINNFAACEGCTLSKEQACAKGRTACRKMCEAAVRTQQNEVLSVLVEGLENSNQRKLVFIQHGLAANREHPVVNAAKKAFLQNGYVVVTFDSRHSLGKSGQDVQNARLATFAEDLKTVVQWAEAQDFYAEPFAVAGHSLGGASAWTYAIENPERTAYWVGIAPVVGGRAWEKACFENMPAFCRDWKSRGAYTYQTPDKKQTALISYQTLQDAKTFDAAAAAADFKVSALLIGAEKDTVVPPRDVEELYRLLPASKSMAVIKDSTHNFVGSSNQEALTDAIDAFLKSAAVRFKKVQTGRQPKAA